MEKETKNILVDLSKEVVINAYRPTSEGGQEEIAVRTSFAVIVQKQLSRLATFQEALLAKSLISKTQEGGNIELNDTEFNVLFHVVRALDTTIKLEFAEMVSGLNPDFDIVEYEKNLNP